MFVIIGVFLLLPCQYAFPSAASGLRLGMGEELSQRDRYK